MRLLQKEVIIYLLIIFILSTFTLIKIRNTNDQPPFLLLLIIPAILSLAYILIPKLWYLSIPILILTFYFNNIAEALFVPAISLALIGYVYRNKSIKQILNKLDLKTKTNTFEMITKIIMWLTILMFTIGITNFILMQLGISDNVNVIDTVKNFSLPLIITAITIAPITEELLFRGLLYNKIGIWGSSIIFAILHFGYGSIAEIIIAFEAGLLFCLVRRYEKNLLIPIIIHIIVNTVSLLAMLYYF